ncbi:MAG TPA: metallopeptidase family protein [Thermoanaerobaculia bacterium]|nr:metallopeptidase family protein [Thermoanaerobaculia bacterium]
MLRVRPDRFEKLVAQAIDSLPREFADMLDNVFVAVEETPSAEDLAGLEMEPHEADELLGLYQGTPLGERGTEYVDLPDRVVLYRRSILAVCESEEDVRQEVRDTLIHELGHHFGLDDEEMPY